MGWQVGRRVPPRGQLGIGEHGPISGTAQVRRDRSGAGGPRAPHARGLKGPAPLAAAPNQRPGPTPASSPQLVVRRSSADALANGHSDAWGLRHLPMPRLTFREHRLYPLGSVPTSWRTAAHSALTQTPMERGQMGPKASRRQWWGQDADPAGEALGPGLPEDTGSCVSCPQKGAGTALGAKLLHELALEARDPAVQALRSDLPDRLPRASP